ncbi:helix-turn-helix domain-containing protein [Enterococcus sp. AZ109]|uniref:helix-turn-helix domain-containing protein n=1 Tax=Enterococcus sp. AZ109 TaxID=2774634 RepID=UPI003F21EEB1
MFNVELVNDKLTEKGITAYKLSKLVGIPTSHMTKILSGKVEDPRFSLVCKFADALGITVDDLRKNNGGD